MKSYFKTAALGFAVLTATTISQAGSSSANLAVNATVPVSCSVAVGILAFGTNGSANSQIGVTCSSGLPYKVAMDGGQNRSGTQPGLFSRRMSNGSGGFVNYTIRKPSPSNTQEWGDSDFANTYPDGSSFAGTGTGEQQNLPFTGNRDFNSASPPGSYTDTVAVTVNF